MRSIVLVATLAATASASDASPIEKIIQMIGDLETKIIGEGEASQKTYEEFSEWCEETSKNLGFEIKTGKGEVADLQATITKDTADIQTAESKIEDLAGSIATDEADLKAATEIRDKEQTTFAAVEKDLVETIDVLERAVGIIEKEMAGGASMMQLKSAGSVVQALSYMVKAQVGLSTADGAKLTALVQQSQEDDDTGAPDPAVYESQSGGVVDTLNSLLEEAQTQLEQARSTETADVQNFEMLRQSLEDEIKFANKEMDEAKKAKSESAESKATAEGDLEVTQKSLNEDLSALGKLHHDCMSKAQEFEAEVTSRGEELKALATAKKIIIETTSGAAGQSYGFLQLSKIQSRSDLANSEVVHLVRQLAKKQHSTMFSQLAARISSEMRFGSGSKADIFGKIKGLITDMIEKLESEAEADATKKAYCDKELAETNQKKADKTAEIEKLTAKIEQQTAHSQKLKSEIATLESELASLVREQAEMDKIRAEEKSAWETNSAEMEKGLNGIKLALKVLNEYYAKADKAHNSGDGASTGIIGLLEVAESDFSKGLTEMNAAEETAANTYDQESKENEIEKTTKEQDVKYKTKESTGLDKSNAELTSDKGNVETELSAVNEYLSKIEEECIAKPETYAERKARREAEINGLKEALSVLENEMAFIQRGTKHFMAVRKH
jgi:hypothetical protein